MAIQHDCKYCGGSGIVIKNGQERRCKCIIENQLKSYLEPALLNAKINKKLLESLINEGKMSRFSILKGNNAKCLGLVKTFVISKFLQTSGDYTYILSNDQDMQDRIFKEDMFVSDLIKPDFLFYKLQGYKHNSIPPTLLQVLQARLDEGKETWIWAGTDKHFGADTVYGSELVRFLRDEFKIIGKNK